MKRIKEHLRRRLLGQDHDLLDVVNGFPFGQPVEPDLLRERINREDALLNSRTNIFLLLNGLAGIAVTNLKAHSDYYWLVSLLAVLINTLWFYCSRQCLRVLAAVTRSLLKVASEEPVEKLVQDVLGACHFGRPNTILGIYLPGLAVISWLALFLVASPWPLRLSGAILVTVFVLSELRLLLKEEAHLTNVQPERTKPDDGTPEQVEL